MRARTILCAVVAALLLGVAAFGQSTVAGTKHDLRTLLTGSGTGQICVYCHTPHGSTENAVFKGHAPLWNQTVSTNASYGTYASDTLNASVTAIANTSYASSLLCLSCHDGTIAVGTSYNPPNGETVTPVNISGGALLGTDLSNDHPVNFTYDSTLVSDDGGLVAVATVQTAGLLVGTGGDEVQCDSCHDPHVAGDDTNVNFMRGSLDGSALCIECHEK